ncbi:hypothetical protein M0R45_008911 [Rubus argutus]|uniref:Uncharacterized protein n=1 Tax=Rubus argutus TaxID=59490 RepID=A0AAW1Y2I4_RUBAR
MDEELAAASFLGRRQHGLALRMTADLGGMVMRSCTDARQLGDSGTLWRCGLGEWAAAQSDEQRDKKEEEEGGKGGRRKLGTVELDLEIG